jgi:hypothetical protein
MSSNGVLRALGVVSVVLVVFGCIWLYLVVQDENLLALIGYVVKSMHKHGSCLMFFGLKAWLWSAAYHLIVLLK